MTNISEEEKKNIEDFIKNFNEQEGEEETKDNLEINSISISELDNFNSDTLIEKKHNLYNHIHKKSLKFYEQQRLLEHKLFHIKRGNTIVILLLLLFSTILTLIESFRELYDIKIYGSTIILSTFITFLSSYSKVMKYQESLEELVKSLEKCLITQIELKKVQEQLIFCPTDEEFEKIKTNYINNVYLGYLNCQMEIFKAVPKNQQTTYIKNIYDIDVRLKNEYKKKLSKMTTLDSDINKLEIEIKDDTI